MVRCPSSAAYDAGVGQLHAGGTRFGNAILESSQVVLGAYVSESVYGWKFPRGNFKEVWRHDLHGSVYSDSAMLPGFLVFRCNSTEFVVKTDSIGVRM
jgi:hypothetical protein